MKRTNRIVKGMVGATFIMLIVGLMAVTAVWGEETDGWSFGAGLVPPGISIDFDGTKKVNTGFNIASGGASVSISKGEGFKYFELGFDSYFRFEQGETGNVGFGLHLSGLEKNGWSLFRIGGIGWIEREDNINWTLIVGIGLPNIYERE